MYYQPIDKPSSGRPVSPEHARRYAEHLRNIDRLIAYNNRRCRAGLRPVSYPPALIGIK